MAGIYIHIPFCTRKCLYCDFYSVEESLQIPAFMDALRKEIASAGPAVRGMEFSTLYFGGGTPSLLPPEEIRRVMEAVQGSLGLAVDAEITMEVNPGTVTRETLEGYRQLGVNRLSIGIQSGLDDELGFLGRIHDRAQSEEALGFARTAGFDNISVDIIQSLPMQSTERVRKTLEWILAYEPEHISAYSLIVEEGTPLAGMVERKEVAPLDADNDAAIYIFTADYLSQRHYRHYEISNFALAGFESRHNSNYWNHTPYVGFGPSAHSFIGTTRSWNVRDIREYCTRILADGSAREREEHLTAGQLLEEYIFLGLRSEGIRNPVLKERYGFTLPPGAGEELERWIDRGFAVRDGDLFHLTSRGFAVCDGLTGRLLTMIPSDY